MWGLLFHIYLINMDYRLFITNHGVFRELMH